LQLSHASVETQIFTCIYFENKRKKKVFSIILAILIFLLLFNYCVSKHLEKIKKLKKYKNKGKIQK
jgi:uncharacterized integral membrane protein